MVQISMKYVVMLLSLVHSLFPPTIWCTMEAEFSCRRSELQDGNWRNRIKETFKHTSSIIENRKKEIFSWIENQNTLDTSDDTVVCLMLGGGPPPIAVFPPIVNNATNLRFFCESSISDADTSQSMILHNRKLYVLMFNFCTLSTFTFASFSVLPNLSFLVVRLSNLEILKITTALPKPSFSTLKWLDLSQNGMVLLSYHFVCSLNSLVLLDLSNNKLTDNFFLRSESDTNCELSNLLWLDLAHNHLLLIPKLISGLLPNLEVLIINNNLIHNVDNTFVLLPKVRILDLATNYFTTFDFQFVPTCLQVLMLQDNQYLRVVNDKSRKSRNFDLQVLNLTSNHLLLLTFHKECCAPKSIVLDSTIVNNLVIVEGNSVEQLQLADNEVFLIIGLMTTKHAVIHKLKTGNYWKKVDPLVGDACFCVVLNKVRSCSKAKLKLLDKPAKKLSSYLPNFTLDSDGIWVRYCICEYWRNGVFLNESFNGDMYSALDFRQQTNDDLLMAEINDSCLRTKPKYDEEVLFSANTLIHSSLNYSHSNIDYLVDGAFKDQKEINVLDLSDNMLTKIRGSEFNGLTNLTELYLKNNEISTISSGGFSEMNQLEILSLARNLLSSLHNNSFLGLRNLLALELHENKLEHIDDATFKILQSLRKLTLHENSLKVIVHEGLPSNLQVLTLRHNLFPCDCSFLKPFREFLLSSKTVVVDSNETVCYFENGTPTQLSIFEYTDEECYTSTIPFHEMNKVIFWILVSIGIFLATILVLLIALYVYREEVKIWCFYRFGVRVSDWLRKSTEEVAKTYDVFVSYSTADDTNVINLILNGLEQRNYRVCTRYSNFCGGAFILNELQEVIPSSHRTLVVLSPNFVNNVWCTYEFEAAHCHALKNRINYLIVVLLEPINDDISHLEIRAHLRTHTYISWGTGNRFWQKLLYKLPSPPRHLPDDQTNLTTSV